MQIIEEAEYDSDSNKDRLKRRKQAKKQTDAMRGEKPIVENE